MNRRILNILALSGHVSESMVQVIENFMSEWNCTAYQALLDTNVLTQPELADFLAHFFKMDRIYNISTLSPDISLFKKISFEKAMKYRCLPLKYLDDEKTKLEVFLCDPTMDDVIQEIKKFTSCDLTIAIGERDDIVKAIKDNYPVENQIPMLSLGGE